MNAQERAAYQRIRNRSWLMHDEARDLLLHSAQQTGDSTAVTLAAAVVTALQQLRDYAAEQGLAEGSEG